MLSIPPSALFWKPVSGSEEPNPEPNPEPTIAPPRVLVAERGTHYVIVNVFELAVAQLDATGEAVDQHGERLAAVGELDDRLFRAALREEVDRDLALGRAHVTMLDPDLLEL